MKKDNSITIDNFKKLAGEGFAILDTRETCDFTRGFIPGSLFVGSGIQFEEWIKKLLPFNTPILLIVPEGKENETIKRFYEAGFEKVGEFLEGGYSAWENSGEKIDLIIDIEADELAIDIPFDHNLKVVDVRNYNEFAEGHVMNAINLPLDEMVDVARIAEFEESHNIYLHSGTGYRSVIAASLFKRQGYHNLRNVTGGWAEIKKQKNIVTGKDASKLN